jgi:serine/threonine protein phosphatase 1
MDGLKLKSVYMKGVRVWENNKIDFIDSVKRGRIRIRRSIDDLSDGINLSDDEIRLIAWLLTDGNQDKHGVYHIYQSKTENVSRIEDLLNRLNYIFYRYERQRNIEEICGKRLLKKPLKSVHFSLGAATSKEVRKFFPNKYPFYSELLKMNKRQTSIFLEEVSLGDGSNYGERVNEGTHRIYGLPELLNNIQTLCVSKGYSASIHTNELGHKALNITKSSFCNIDISNRINSIKYEGKVWCLKVPNENFMIRRNGKAFFTGNCWAYNWMTSGWMQPIWTKQGGQATIDSYELDQVKEWVAPNVPKEHKDFLRNAAHAVELEDNRLLVHGGIDWDKPLDEHSINELTWDRELVKRAWTNHPIKGRKKGVTTYKEVFVGHTTTEAFEKDLLPLNYCEVWLLDTGAGWSGKLTIMDIDTKEFWQSDLVSELYPDDKGRSFDDF